MAKHTPGPWAVHPIKAQVDCGALDEDGDLLPLCQLLWPTAYRGEDETLANAHLIAAAPDLLAAAIEANRTGAKTVNGNAAISPKAFDMLAAAIARATTQGD